MTSPVATLGSPQLGRPNFPYMGPLLSNITALPPYISEALKATFPAARATFFQVKFLSGGSELVRCMPSMAHDPQYLMLCAPALKAAVDGRKIRRQRAAGRKNKAAASGKDVSTRSFVPFTSSIIACDDEAHAAAIKATLDPLIAHINAALYSPHGTSGLTVRLVAPTDAANLNVSPGASASAPSILIAPSNWITRMAAGLPPNMHYLMQGARYIATFSSLAAKELEFINRIFRPKDSPTTIHAYRLGHPGPVIDATLKWLRLGVHEWPDQDDYDDDGAEGKAWINDPERTQYLKARKVALEETSAEKSKGPSTR